MVISKTSQMLIKILLLAALSNNAVCQFINKHWNAQQMLTPSGKELKVSWAISMSEKMQGLSGLAHEKMSRNDALLFFYRFDDERSFWMPNTHFDLDIIFLDKDFKVVALEENVRHFKAHGPQSLIPITKKYKCRYVLEIKSGMAKKLGIKVASNLKWKNTRDVQKFLHSLEK